MKKIVLAVALAVALHGAMAADQGLLAAAQSQQAPLLATLKELVLIESGSSDAAGLARMADYTERRLKTLGAAVERKDGIVTARLHGKGSRKLMLIAHMDTVYLKGMLKDQPFRIDGDKAYGLGIADDKQGVATIIHTVALLQKLNFKDYGTLTVLINGDEEISSPGWRSTTADRPQVRASNTRARPFRPCRSCQPWSKNCVLKRGQSTPMSCSTCWTAGENRLGLSSDCEPP